MPQRQSLRLSNLQLDLLNPRYEEQKSQNEAINTIAREQKEKLIVLLKDIIENGLNPSDIPIVMPDSLKDNSYIVLEGNRRIAALKLFQKPEILSDTSMELRYRKLHDKHKDRIIKTIECLVVDTREEASLWIERKHEGEMNGAGTVRWDNVQKSRFLANKTGRNDKVLQLIDFMKDAANGDSVFLKQLRKVSATNLERFLSTPDVRTTLGLEYNDGEYSSRFDWHEVLKGLKAVVNRLSQDDFNVKTIYHKKDRINLIHEIPLNELPDKTKKIDTAWKLKDFKCSDLQSKSEEKNENEVKGGRNESENDASNKEENSQKQRPTKRTKFLPDELTLSIPNDRSNRIFCELKQMSHLTLPNACSVLMRVFIELSVDCYLEEFGLLKNGAISGARDSRTLLQKANTVILHLIQKKYLDETKAKGLKTEMNKPQSIFSIDTMNAYVHNGDFNPIPESLMLSWDNVQPFIIALWKAINDDKK